MALPSYNTTDTTLSLMQSGWASLLNPLLSNPVNNGILLKSLVIKSGSNVINHKLGRKLQGWIIVRKRASADIYDTQDSNTTPTLTLSLQSSADVIIDLYVF